jgi:hypothetical protein
MEAVGTIGVSGFSARANETTRVFLKKLSKISSNIVIVDIDNKLEEKTLRAPHKDIKSYACLVSGCTDIFFAKYNIKKHCEEAHGILECNQREDREFSIVYQRIRVYYCHICQNGVEFKSIRNFQLHLQNRHQLTDIVFKDGNLLYYKNPTNAPVIKKCNVCYKDFDTVADREDHLNNFNHNDYFQCYYPDCTQTFSTYMAVNMHYRKFHSEIIRYTPHQFCMAYHLYKEMQEVQNNTSATNTTTNNMDSTRKRSHYPAIHEEEVDEKKARLNPSESGYTQSDSFISISGSWDDGMLSITEYNSVDDIPATGNNDLITTDVQPSATSDSIDNGVYEPTQKSTEVNDDELFAMSKELLESDVNFVATVNQELNRLNN